MRIGIDIDDVITDTSAEVKKYILEYDKNGELSNHMQELMRGDASIPAIKKFYDDNSIKIFENAKTKKDSADVINRLFNNGHEIILITSRGEKVFKGSKIVTLEYLKSHNINYTEILFDSHDKAKICEEKKIDVMVDDSVKYCQEIKEKDIKSILFTSEVNKSINVSLDRVNNWLELEKKINEIN